mmetsp:Transcript_1751/g.1228  ORF Transcript_1751/g.1228 Transcript_1751/m.1228 type:complete len:313 (-) Transcript_1751:1861-2799(-)
MKRTKQTIKIGTRGSKLALWQAGWVKSVIEKQNPSYCVKLEVIKTKGDNILDVPLAKVGGKGLFVKEIEQAMLEGKINLAVHSMKDMPAIIPNGLCIGAVPKRENQKDVLISKKGLILSALKKGVYIGTSSLRRSAQLLAKRPDFKIVPLRGNLETRLKKLKTQNLDAIILAAAGVKRLGYEEHITQYIDENIILPAVGQGALCIETRDNDLIISEIIAPLNCKETKQAVFGERAFLSHLEGGCQVPIAASGKIENNNYILTGLVADIKGKTVLKKTMMGDLRDSESIGIELAKTLISMGADKILEKYSEGC